MKLNMLKSFYGLVVFTVLTGSCDSRVTGQEFNGQFRSSPPLRPALNPGASSLLEQGKTAEDGTTSESGSQPPLLPLRNEAAERRDLEVPEGQSMRQDAPSSALAPRFDDSLQPAAWQQPASGLPAQSTQGRRSPEVAKFLLAELQQSSRNFMAQYQPMGLEDMLANCDDRRRKDMVRQYWIAWQACADFLFAHDETLWVSQLAQPRDESERLVLEAARATVADAMLEKEIAMMRELELLNGFLTGPVSETLPWPTDMPMVGEYRTHYETWAAAGHGSEELRILHTLLPRQFELIASRAATIQQCSSAIQRATASWNQTGSGSATLLQALYLSRESHDAFSRSVADYNHKIAEYALTLKPDAGSDSAMVAMLLPGMANPGQNRTIPGNEGLRQASLPDDGIYRSSPPVPLTAGNTGTQGMANQLPTLQDSRPVNQPGSGGTLQPAFSPPASQFRR